MAEWQLERQQHGIAVATDNAGNMDVAVREAGLAPHQVFGVPCVAHLLSRIRRIVTFFHRSADSHCCVGCEAKSIAWPGHQ